MSDTYFDPNDNDPGYPGPQEEKPSWGSDPLKKIASYFTPASVAKKPSLYEQGLPVLEAANIPKSDPQHALLKMVSDHIGGYPMPTEPTMGQKLGGGFLNALGAGALRSAGASPEGSQAATRDMIGDWNARRTAAEGARVDAWKTGGNLALPMMQTAVQQAEARKILAQQAAANRGRMFGEEAPPAATAAPGSAPAAPGPIYPHDPGGLSPAASPGGPQATAPAQAAGQPGRTAGAIMPGGPLPPEPDRPMYQLGQGPHFFYTEQWRNAADSILRGNIDNNALLAAGLKPVDPSKGKEAQAEDVLIQLKKADEAAHQASPAYQGKTAEAKAFGEGRVKRSDTMEDKLDQGAEAAQNANRTLDIMRSAFDQTQKSGVLGPGFATSWLTNINNGLERIGLPHMETAPIQMINELSNRMGIESMMEEMSAGNGMKGGGQRMFMAFREAVANTSQNPTGFAAIMEAMQALNNMHIARQQAKNEYKGALEARSMPPILDYKAQQYINEQAKGAFDKAAVAIDRVLQSATGGAAPGKGVAAPPMSKEDMRVAVKKAIDASGGKLSVKEAMDQVAGAQAPTAAGGAPGAAPAAPAPTGGVPERPSQSGFTQRVWDWSYPEQAAAMAKKRKQQEEDLGRINGLIRPMGPR
jgi:hypothetical protein